MAQMQAANANDKRTSIQGLLNPLQSSREQHSFPPGHHPSLAASVATQSQLEQGGQPFQPSLTSGTSTFHLRAASWDSRPDDQIPPRRKPENGPPSRHYHDQHPPANTGESYAADHAARFGRTRGHEQNGYAMEATTWPLPQEIANLSYAGPVTGPMYSDERTALSGDYAANNQYSHPYPEQSTSAGPPTSGYFIHHMASRDTIPMGMPPRGYMQPAFYHPQAIPYAAMPMPPPPIPQPPAKRVLEEDDSSASASKSKKAKSKAKPSADSSSKRGYNAKKRNEAAQIAAQNAQLMPTVSYAQTGSEKGKEPTTNTPMHIVNNNAPQQEASGPPLHPELQFARCMSNRYRSEQFPRCVSCTRRWAGDTCRFQGIRFFLKDAQRNIVGISFVEHQKADAPSMNFPNDWNIPIQPMHIRRTKRTIARALLPTLRHELDHLKKPQVIRRPRESDVRATCDTCMTSIFSSSWMCRQCGREACSECFHQVKDLTEDRPGASDGQIAALQARREKHAHSNPFFLSCTRRNEHGVKDFSPMSRFCQTELSVAIEEMEAELKLPDLDALPVIGAIDPSLDAPQTMVSGSANSATTTNGVTSTTLAEPQAPTGTDGVPEPASTTIPAVPPATSAPQGLTAPSISTLSLTDEIPHHETKRFTDAELTEDVFRAIWAQGEPLVVSGLLPKFKIQWTPEYFIEKYATQSCLIIDCQTEVNKRVTVAEFFEGFGKYEGRKQSWKLKDWPSSTDFKVSFPELYEDFSEAVPVPNYVRRDGALNLASHFPSNTIAPDLGPKMYNAMSSFETLGSKGSTRLHMDMADAVNIMTYASPAADGSPGCAAWDLYRAEDSDQIRKFLKKKFQGTFQHDPIHAQLFYLHTGLRKELWENYGVKSHRVYQRPGEAVFIPAGCAHQVANLADCVKVAVDFVSPENIDRCEKLTKEFREQNQSMVWKEDVLQLRTMMWFAWLSCRRQEQD